MRKLSLISAVAVLVALATSIRLNAQQVAAIIDLGTVGGVSSAPNAINEFGDVVGSATFPGVGAFRTRGFLWTGGQMQPLPPLPQHGFNNALGVNNSRQVVGHSYNVSANGLPVDQHAVTWQNGVVSDLNTPSTAAAGWVLLVASGINDAGQIIGQGQLNGVVRGFLLDAGGILDLGTLAGGVLHINPIRINRNNQILGFVAFGPPDFRSTGVLWTNGTIIDLTLPGDFASFGVGINDAGAIVGNSRATATSSSRPILWTNLVASALPTLGDPITGAADINNVGQIVGIGSSSPGTTIRAILWQDGVPEDLESFVPGNELTTAIGINDAGQIIGVMASGHAFLMQIPVSPANVVALIETLLADSPLRTSLIAKIHGIAAELGLQMTVSALDTTPNAAGCNRLRALLNELNALAGKQIATDVAAQLTNTISRLASSTCQ